MEHHNPRPKVMTVVVATHQRGRHFPLPLPVIHEGACPLATRGGLTGSLHEMGDQQVDEDEDDGESSEPGKRHVRLLVVARRSS